MFEMSIADLTSNLVLELSTSTVGTVFGLFFTHVVQKRIEEKRFGNWKVYVLARDGQIATRRPVSVKKIQQVLNDDDDLSVYIKGLVSPFERLNVDPCTEGVESELLKIDHASRTITVDLAKNPEKVR